MKTVEITISLTVPDDLAENIKSYVVDSDRIPHAYALQSLAKHSIEVKTEVHVRWAKKLTNIKK